MISGRQNSVTVLSNDEKIESTGFKDAILSSPFTNRIMLVEQDERKPKAIVAPQMSERAEYKVISNDFKELFFYRTEQKHFTDYKVIHN